jgi:4'-phosphopantetheinyl transferase
LPGAGHLSESPCAVAAKSDTAFLDVWVLPVSSVRTERADLSVLDAQEQGRVAKIIRDQDRDSYLVAHLAVRHLLGKHLGVAPAEIVLSRDPCPNCAAPHGRPVLAGPARPVEFSLSHGGDLVLVGIAETAVGVDVEAVPDGEVAANLCARLHPDEQREITAAERLDDAFARVWARKEAYLKGIGTGLSRGLSTDYLGASGLAALPAGWTVLDVPVPAGYAGAAAVWGPAPPTRVLQFPPAVIEGTADALD